MCPDCVNMSLYDCISGLENPENGLSKCICNTTGETRKILLSMGGFVQADRESSVDILEYVKGFCSDLSPISEREISLTHSHTPPPDLLIPESNCEMCEISQSVRCEISPDSEVEIICPSVSSPSPLPCFPKNCPVEGVCRYPTPSISPPPLLSHSPPLIRCGRLWNKPRMINASLSLSPPHCPLLRSSPSTQTVVVCKT